MTTFFASVGFTASFKILKNGGIKVAMFLGIAILLIISQNVVGGTLAKLFNLRAFIRIMYWFYFYDWRTWNGRFFWPTFRGVRY